MMEPMSSREQEHMETVRKIAPECMVLLKSDGSFPLDAPCRIAAYGGGVRHTIKGGTGSGDVNVRHFESIEEALTNAGFSVTTGSWLDAYDKQLESDHQAYLAEVARLAKEQGTAAIGAVMGKVQKASEYEIPLDADADASIYVLMRNSGEGSDREAVPGDFELTRTEIRDILALNERFSKFMLVLNVGGPIDLTPVADAVHNILLLSQLGMATGTAFADVLIGRAYPSGKLTSTWASWDAYCHEGDFGAEDETEYREGIYVGYKYFDSIGREPLFPFGYGLSYTTFDIVMKGIGKADSPHGDGVIVEATVTNTGLRAGREVVEAYISAPEARLDKPVRQLVAYAKTRELGPGESETVELRFRMRDVASYDEGSASCILEPGHYIVSVGADSRHTAEYGCFVIDSEITVKHLSNVLGKPGFTDWKPESVIARYDEPNVPVLHLDAADFIEEPVSRHVVDPAAVKLAESLSDEELAYVCTGGYGAVKDAQVVGNSSGRVVGAAGETTSMLEAKGIPVAVTADGPAGLRLAVSYGHDSDGNFDIGDIEPWLRDIIPADIFNKMVSDKKASVAKRMEHAETRHHYCTAIPIGTALAQSYNPATVESCGDLVGAEMEEYDVDIWLAPALNIHRLPLCGRNFEYYSEDPLVAGLTAAAIARGVHRHPGRTVTYKHFACNNQETNRNYSDSRVSERALREIYLKAFEIAIANGPTVAIMSSYNLINGVHTSESSDLLTTVLRDEWGYKGFVMTDWLIRMPGVTDVDGHHAKPGAHAPATLLAGNDLFMPGSQYDHDEIMIALADGVLTRDILVRSASRVIESVWQLRRPA